MLLLSIKDTRETHHSGEVGGVAFLREQVAVCFCTPEA